MTTQGRFCGIPGFGLTAAARCISRLTALTAPSAWYMSREELAQRGLPAQVDDALQRRMMVAVLAHLDEVEAALEVVDDLLIARGRPPLDGVVELASRGEQPVSAARGPCASSTRWNQSLSSCGEVHVSLELRGLDGEPERVVQVLDEAMEEVVGDGVDPVDQRVVAVDSNTMVEALQHHQLLPRPAARTSTPDGSAARPRRSAGRAPGRREWRGCGIAWHERCVAVTAAVMSRAPGPDPRSDPPRSRCRSDRRIMLSGMPKRWRSSGVHFVVAHHQRLLDQRLDAAQAGGDARNLARRRRRRPSARQSASFTRNVTSPPKPRIVLLGDFVIRDATAGPDSRPARRADGRRGTRRRAMAVLVVPLHPQLERLQPALAAGSMLCGELIAPMMPRSLRTGSSFSFVPMIDAGQQVVVPAEVLGRRVQHVIDAVRRSAARCTAWPAWRRSASRRRACWPISANRSRSTTLRCGLVGDSLTSSLRLRRDRRFHRLVVAGLHLPRDDAEPRQVLGAELAAAVITLVEEDRPRRRR